ncbi:MAG: acetyltransferase, partial [Bdellovibrionota bacterium]
MHKEKILLIGGGGHCKSCIDVIECEGKYEIAGIIDVESKVGQKVLGYPIIGTDDDIEKLLSITKNVLLTMGQIKSPILRQQTINKLKPFSVNFPVIISPRAYVSRHSSIGPGTIVLHHATINAGATINSFCIINTNAIVEHDCLVHDFCHISTGAIINGNVTLGAGSFVGSQAVIKEGITIHENSIISAGIFIKDNIPA